MTITTCSRVKSGGFSTRCDLVSQRSTLTAAPAGGDDRRIVAGKADVRDRAALRAVVDEGVSQLGRLDIVVANADICPVPRARLQHI